VSENNNTVHLSVQRVTHADAGQYTLLAKNMAGEARGSVMLQVRSQPGHAQQGRSYTDFDVKVPLHDQLSASTC
jgi:hypothetical protein